MLLARRALLILILALASLLPSAATAVSIMDPFNVEPAMDGGSVKLGDGIAYADGPRKKLDVYTPQNPTGSAPVVFFIYGGGWNHGERTDYQFAGRALASRGFVVVIADYRLVPEVRYPEFLEDNAQAIKWIEDNIERYGGDKRRLFLAGHSAGAYNAVMLALDHSFLRDHGVTIPIQGIAALSGPYDFYPFEYNEVREAFGTAPNPEGTQPINLVTPDTPPIFLASGTTDPIVRVQNTENLARRLREQGVWVTEKYYEGFGHMEPVLSLGALWRWRMPVLDDVVTFFSQFGAFPSGVPRVAIAPDTEHIEPMAGIIAELDAMFQPITPPAAP